MARFRCPSCDYVYDEDAGDPREGWPPARRSTRSTPTGPAPTAACASSRTSNPSMTVSPRPERGTLVDVTDRALPRRGPHACCATGCSTPRPYAFSRDGLAAAHDGEDRRPGRGEPADGLQRVRLQAAAGRAARDARARRLPRRRAAAHHRRRTDFTAGGARRRATARWSWRRGRRPAALGARERAHRRHRAAALHLPAPGPHRPRHRLPLRAGRACTTPTCRSGRAAARRAGDRGAAGAQPRDPARRDRRAETADDIAWVVGTVVAGAGRPSPGAGLRP